ncbi:hypothetical protein ACFL9T_00540 [Thermodesulfobacteriota bacterium]
MIDRPPFPYKTIGRWFLICSISLLSAYIVFLGSVSLWVGFNHSGQEGFWMPILAGTVLIMSILWLFGRFLLFILRRVKEKGSLN